MYLLQKFLDFLEKHKFEWAGITISIVGFLVTLSTNFDYSNINKPTEISFSQQIEKLDDVQKSLNTLSTFISEQKIRLQQNEKTLANLQSEQEKLKPVVEADKERDNVWVERFIGLFIGIAGSLIASLIYAVLKTKKASIQSDQSN